MLGSACVADLWEVVLIVSLDRKMSMEALKECLDICGDPMAGDMSLFGAYLAEAREAGLGVTVHIAETKDNPTEETLTLLLYAPNCLGHASFLNDEAREIVRRNKTCIEICLSSNLLCKTVPSLESHHIRYYLAHRHPIAICTDDILPFRTSLLGEYTLLLTAPPLELGLSEEEVREAAGFSFATGKGFVEPRR